MDEARVLLDLLEAPSPSGHEEPACAIFAEHASRLGFRVEWDAVGNVIARIGHGGPHAMFLGHIDTVSGFLPVRSEGDWISGRGAVDAKAALTAGLLAAARVGSKPSGNLTVVAAVGEEADSRGTLSLLRTSPPDALIVGEPSGWNRVTVGYRGQRIGFFRGSSVPTHPSAPDAGPLDQAVVVAARLRDLIATRTGPTMFDSPSCRIVRWNPVRDTERESAEFEVDVRFPEGFDWDDLEAACPEIRWSRTIDAVRVHKGNPVVRALVAGIRRCGGRPEYVLKGGTSDMNHAARVWPIPMASYGPGNPRLDHGPKELVSIHDFLRSIDTLEHALRALGATLTSSG